MAYTSDLRIKNILKDIHSELINDLNKFGITKNPILRIFDESNEDGFLFEEGGLTFADPISKHKYGSNDAAWIYNDKPLVVIEGTFGTERGQFGDGQLNRFSHSLGVARNGSIGVTFIPYKGESYSKRGSAIPSINKSIKLKYAHIHNGFLKGAININEREKGFFLVVDAYDTKLLKNLIIETFKKEIGLKNNQSKLINEIINSMKKQNENFKYGKQSKGLIDSFYNSEGVLISSFSRAYTQNFSALTDSSKRDGHGLLGKCLLESYISGNEDYYAIFLRLSRNDISKLKKRNQKEFKFIAGSENINIVSFDDLKFKDQQKKLKLEKIRNTNLFRDRQDTFLKEIQFDIKSGDISLKSF